MNKFLALLFAFCFQFSIAQTWQPYYPTFGFDVNAVAILGPGSISIGGGQETNDSFQIMVHTDDYGHSWNENIHDGLAPWNKSIAFSSPLNGFGVGNDGRIIQTDDAGLHWGFAVTPFNRDWNKIVNVNAQTYYAAGGNRSNDSLQSILKTNDGGANWLLVLDQPGPWLRSVYFTDTLNGIAVGDSGVILKTINAGALWTPVVPPVQRNFTGITFVNGNTGFITGGNSNHRTILRTDDGGNNWTVVVDTTGGILNDISFAGLTTAYVVGDSATLLKTTDGGINWLPQSVDNALTGAEEIRSVAFYDTSFGVIGGKQGLLYVYSPPVPYDTLRTEQASALSYTSATLVGTVKSNTVPMNVYFEYDTTPVFTHYLSALPAVINDTLPHLVTAVVQSLTPFTLYYYRLKVVVGGNPYYANLQTFSTNTPSQNNNFVTLTATQVTDTSAVLHGSVEDFISALPAEASFEFGTTTALGSLLQAGTVALNDTSLHFITAQLSGLPPDTSVYYYRLRVISGTNIFYGNTRTLHTGLPEIPNWDFQNWQTQTSLLPTGWFFTSDSFARVSGHTGNYALQLTGPVVAAQGFPVGNLVGGAPFAARPDSFSVYAKYNIEEGDTAYVALSLVKGGQQIAPFKLYPITGSSGGQFKRIAYHITYNSAATPDSVIMLITPSNAFSESDTGYLHSTLTVDDIAFSQVSDNVYNYNFESWYSYTVERPSGWFGGDYLIDSAHLPLVPTLSKVLLSHPGDYALQVKNIDLLGHLVNGQATTAVYAFNKTPDFPISHHYESLSGYYEFFPEGGDSAQIDVQFKKGGRFGVAVAYGKLSIKQAASSFTPFDLTINYTGDTGQIVTVPDWANISINHLERQVFGHSRFIVDKLSFDGFIASDSVVITTTEELVSTEVNGIGVKVYPNPAGNYLYAEVMGEGSLEMKLQLFSLSGQVLREAVLAANQNKTALNVSGLAPGLYLLRLAGDKQVYNQKVSIVR